MPFLLDMTVDLAPVGMLIQQVQYVEPTKVVTPKVCVDPPQEFVIFRRVDRPAVAGGFRSIGLDEGDAEAIRVPIEKRSHVFAPGRLRILMPRGRQGGKREYLDVEAAGK